MLNAYTKKIQKALLFFSSEKYIFLEYVNFLFLNVKLKFLKKKRKLHFFVLNFTFIGC